MLEALRLDAVDSITSFFNSGLWQFALVLIGLFVVALWLGLAYWTNRDARLRVASAGAVMAFTILALVMPFLGAVLYVVLRPQEYLTDARERVLGLEALERQSYGAYCPDCDHRIERDYLACPSCLRKLRDPCVRCSRPLDPRWKICPYCETATTPSMSGSASLRSEHDLFGR
ncbi:MAG: zinc ribbon domain-containing protein [Actinobacteria bacterium]|nr:zinc ribbon domain-containing protein [Actinomycetota bacterium]